MKISSTGDARQRSLTFGSVLATAWIGAGGFVGCDVPGESGRLTQTTPQAGQADPASGDIEAFTAFAECMREHGITNYPDPTVDGINLKGTGIDPNTPEFQAAEEACREFLPGGGERRAPAASGPPPEAAEMRRPRSGPVTAWDKIVPGGGCECADGSEFAFFAHHGDPTRLVFYLDGGGVCFDAASCANANTPGTGERPGPDYDPDIRGENPAREGGMLDLGRPDNPFRGYSAIYVPLCTADSHLGDATHEYAPGLTVRHKGFVNGMAALDYAVQQFANAAQVVIVGHTTVATPLYGGIASDRLPGAQVIVFATQAGAIPDVPALNAQTGENWGFFAHMPDWDVNEGLAIGEWGRRQFWISAGLHDPEMIMARFDYAFDANAVGTLEYLAIPGVDPENTLAVIDANDAAIEAAGVTLHSYTAPGRHHGILEFSIFYELEVNGVKLVDWVASLLAGDPLDDVRCTDCTE